MSSLVCLLLLLGHVHLAAGTLIDCVVAVVDKEVITQSELLVEARIALGWREGEDAARAELNEDLLAALRDYVINQTLVSAQARRFGDADVSDQEIAQRVWDFKQRFGSSMSYLAFLRRFNISENALEDILRRDLQNESYLSQRLRTRLMGAARDRHEHDSKARYEAALKGWLAELRQGADVRVLSAEGALERP